jgi:LAGLIDADG DNA endonuclease family protein
MVSDNPSGADNQQERPSSSRWLCRIPNDLGHWVSGFVDGEGSFNVPFRRSRDRGLPWRVSLSFNVSQIGPSLPSLLRCVFGTGTVRGRRDGIFYFEITKPQSLEDRVFRFFERFLLRGKKAEDLELFEKIAHLVQSGFHLSSTGVLEILRMRAPMNGGGKRRYSDEEIIACLRNWESSEAIRRAPSLKQRDEDMVHAPWRRGEPVNYNGPKVEEPLSRQRGAAPHTGDSVMRSRLYAGRPGVSHRYSD